METAINLSPDIESMDIPFCFFSYESKTFSSIIYVGGGPGCAINAITVKEVLGRESQALISFDNIKYSAFFLCIF